MKVPPAAWLAVNEVSQTRFPNADCPICRRQIGPDATVRSCLICELTYHRECWDRGGGCVTTGCQNRSTKPTTGAAASTTPRKKVRQKHTPRPADADVALAARQAQVSRKQESWTGAWLAAFGVVVLACVVLTIVVGIVAAQRKYARRELTGLIESARAKDDPQLLVADLEQYLQSDPAERLARLATEELSKARREVDDRDYQRALDLERGRRTNLDRLEKELTAYLQKHPTGSHRQAAEQRLQRIPEERDERAYRRTLRNAQDTGGDLGLEEAAWQSYLDAYPDGRHAAQARAEIARIPDKQDEARLAIVLSEIEPLVGANRLTDALLCIDRGMMEVRSPTRHERLAKHAREIEASLEALDATQCLKSAGRNPLARTGKLAQCRLYLLCYPNGTSRIKVEHRINQLLAAERDDLLHELRRRLTTLKDEPRAALQAIYEFLTHPAARNADVSRELARFHVELLCRSLTDSLRDMKVVTLRDGTELVSAVTRVSRGWVQIKPRPTGTSGPRKSMLEKDTNVSFTEPPLIAESSRLRQRVLMLAAGSDADPEKIAAVIRATRELASGDEFEPERLAFQVCLAGINPADADARQELADAGFVKRGGVYVPAVEPGADEAVDSPHQQTLNYYIDICKTSCGTGMGGTGVGSTGMGGTGVSPVDQHGLLPGSFEHGFLGTTLSVPIKWRLDEPECKSALLSGEGDPFHARIELLYPAIATRTSDTNLPSSILTELDEELASISASTRVEVTCEIQATPQHLTGVGIEARNQGETLLVSRVYADSSADQAGVELGDRVVFVDGIAVPPDATPETLATMIANSPHPGVKLVFVRAGRRFRLTLERAAYTVEKYQVQMAIGARGKLVIDAEKTVSEWIDIPPPP